MGGHYYTNNPDAPHDRKEFKFELRGRNFYFVTDSGVFSRERIDYGSLLLIENMDIPVDAKVLDVGCGYGPIGIVAATLAKQGNATLVDINERAIQLARENIQTNHINNAEALVSNIYNEIPKDKKFDRILTNPPIRAGKKVVHQIFEEAVSYLNPGGELWVVIQKKQGAPSALSKLKEHFTEVEEIIKQKGYRIYRAIHNSGTI